MALVEDIESLDQPVIAIFAQRDPATDDPGQEDLYPVGVAARVLKALKHSSGNYSLILQGLMRVRMEGFQQDAPFIKARVSKLEEPKTEDVEAEALAMSLRDIAKQVIQLMPELPREASSLIDSIQEPGSLADLVAARVVERVVHVPGAPSWRQELCRRVKQLGTQNCVPGAGAIATISHGSGVTAKRNGRWQRS